MAVISISRQYGAGGKPVAEIVAQKLGYTVVDRTLLIEVAKEANISEEWVEKVDREKGDLVARLVPKLLPHRYFVPFLPGTKIIFEEHVFRKFLRLALVKLCENGKVVVLGQGSQLLFRDDPRTIRVFLHAREDERIKSLMKRYRVDRQKAFSIASILEENRLRFLRGFNEGDPEDRTLYHLIINTGLVSYETAARMIVGVVEELGEAK